MWILLSSACARAVWGESKKRVTAVRVGRGYAFTEWYKSEWIMKILLPCILQLFFFFFLGFFSLELCVLGQPDTSWLVWHIQVFLQSPWSSSVLLLTPLQGSAQHASHMNNQNLSPAFKHTRAQCFLFFFFPSPSLSLSPPSFHFLVQFAPSINNSTGNKMEEND